MHKAPAVSGLSLSERARSARVPVSSSLHATSPEIAGPADALLHGEAAVDNEAGACHELGSRKIDGGLGDLMGLS